MIDDNVDTIDLIDWFNQCQDAITNYVYLPTLTTITRDVATGKFLMPTNVNGEFKILTPVGIDVYSVYDDYILFTGSDDLTLTSIEVTYNKLPAEIVNNPDQVPSIPVRFHDIYVFYASMMAMQMQEEPERYDKYEHDYNRTLSQLQKFMGKARPKPPRWAVER